MDWHALRRDIAGCREAHGRLLAGLDGLANPDVARPSLLPDWTVGHVLTHLARNAESHARMLQGALRGEIDDQYPGGRERRNRDIEAGANRPAAELVADVRATCRDLEATWNSMTPDAWEHGRGRTTLGEVPVSDLPFLRWRETEVHHADLGLDFTWRDWTDSYVELELTRTLADLPDRLPDGTTLCLEAPDAGLTWTVPPGATDPPVVVRAPRRHLLAWLLGRASDPDFPALGRWQ